MSSEKSEASIAPCPTCGEPTTDGGQGPCKYDPLRGVDTTPSAVIDALTDVGFVYEPSEREAEAPTDSPLRFAFPPPISRTFQADSSLQKKNAPKEPS